MNEERSPIASQILATYVRPVKRPQMRRKYSELTREEIVSRFLWLVDPQEDGCWRYTGLINDSGYGIISVNRSRTRAHRVSYQLFVGPITDGMQVCHKCDNPPCVNPDHLFVGTNQDNIVDRVRKGRSRRGETCPLSKYKDEMVVLLRKEWESGHSSMSQLSNKFNMSVTNVFNIVHRNTWKHLQ